MGLHNHPAEADRSYPAVVDHSLEVQGEDGRTGPGWVEEHHNRPGRPEGRHIDLVEEHRTGLGEERRTVHLEVVGLRSRPEGRHNHQGERWISRPRND